VGLRGVSRKDLPGEVSAGVTLLALAVPLNIGYAQIAGLPPTAGLYALIVPGIAFALLTTSRQLIAAPDAAAAALVASSLSGLAGAGTDHYIDLAAAQAVVCGGIFLLCWIFRLGFLANFLSEAVLVGFVGGLAVEILLSQVAKMLGVSLEGEDFLVELKSLITQLPETSGWSVLLAALAAAIVLGGRRLARGVPWALVVLVVTTLVTVAGDLADRGVSVLGDVPSGLPPVHVPRIDAGEWAAVAPSALALTMVALAEGLLTARRYAERNHYPVDANAELLAFSGANVAAGFTGGFSVGSSASRTAAVDQARARSQIPTLVTAALATVLLLWGTGLLKNIPSPALAAVIAIAVVPILGVAELRRLWRLRRSEFWVGAVCLVAVLAVGPIRGVLVAVFISVIDVVRRAAAPPATTLGAFGHRDRYVAHDPGQSTVPDGVAVFRFAAPLFFANATTFRNYIQDLLDPDVQTDDTDRHARHVALRWLVLDCEGITDIDVTGSHALDATLTSCHDRGVTVVLSRVRQDLTATLAHYGLLERVVIYDSNGAAVAAART
jgi:high affinity sulfate transporter 1